MDLSYLNKQKCKKGNSWEKNSFFLCSQKWRESHPTYQQQLNYFYFTSITVKFRVLDGFAIGNFLPMPSPYTFKFYLQLILNSIRQDSSMIHLGNPIVVLV